MLATRWSPWNDWTEMQSQMGRLQNQMNSLFGRYGTANGSSFAPRSYPALNVWENDEQLLVEAELPGMELSDMEIYVNGGNQLSLKGERKVPSSEEGTWHRRERGYGKFARVIELPHLVDPDKVQASFKHGVLTIKLPKQEASKPRKIQVKAE
ncbi:Hsp20/alpha crystallin family protein [Bythopirellula polymerisocia]|uniref:Spore protein SP21 n=1 Tax=Bythopirellula polymerisocia TaxID=2528003 RepID=A0A5C6CVD8_9BACT|nr:Hsp20/alpha crystallin family protein [Bythopirellula polymerisocia]TWU27634.1 Spore protein SP21 [Bythopirellula polymerisocia]